MTDYAFIDTETTSLNSRTGDVIEAAWAINQGPINQGVFAHTLENADMQALEINRYWERGMDRWQRGGDWMNPEAADLSFRNEIIRALHGKTIVAENYGFDVGFLAKKLGIEPWHYRKVELSTIAMTVFRLEAPESQTKTRERLIDLGWDIPDNDHTAAADVAGLRACFYALTAIRDALLDGAPLAQYRPVSA